MSNITIHTDTVKKLINDLCKQAEAYWDAKLTWGQSIDGLTYTITAFNKEGVIEAIEAITQLEVVSIKSGQLSKLIMQHIYNLIEKVGAKPKQTGQGTATPMTAIPMTSGLPQGAYSQLNQAAANLPPKKAPAEFASMEEMYAHVPVKAAGWTMDDFIAVESLKAIIKDKDSKYNIKIAQTQLDALNKLISK